MTAKILYIDIETTPNVVFTWGLFKQNIALNQIVTPGGTLCFAARWGHEKLSDYHFYSIRDEDGGEDVMVQAAWDLLDEADIIVHFNGTSFDLPTLNKEFVLRGMTPPSPYKQVDLYRVVRSNFRFVSNKLDFVSQQLGLGSKISHKGMDLWRDCMAGLPAAWKVMKRYNIQDVKLLPKLYKVLVPWVKTHPNMALYVEDASKPTCRNCGGTHLHKRGIERTNVVTYQRFKCTDCGWNGRGRKRLEKPQDGVLA